MDYTFLQPSGYFLHEIGKTGMTFIVEGVLDEDVITFDIEERVLQVKFGISLTLPCTRRTGRTSARSGVPFLL